MDASEAAVAHHQNVIARPRLGGDGLDQPGQVVGVWTADRLASGFVIFPTRIQRLELDVRPGGMQRIQTGLPQEVLHVPAGARDAQDTPGAVTFSGVALKSGALEIRLPARSVVVVELR